LKFRENQEAMRRKIEKDMNKRIETEVNKI